MKRALLIFLTLCLLCTCSLQVLAAPMYKNIMELYQDWEQNGYPLYVSGVYSTDGSEDHLTVLLVKEAAEQAEAEIRAALEDDSTVSFEEGNYGFALLESINEEITRDYLNGSSGIYGCGIGWGSDGQGFGPSGRELRVILTVEESRLEEYQSLFAERYGEAVVVEQGAPIVLENSMERATELEQPSPENDLFGDLQEGPIAAPEKSRTERDEPASAGLAARSLLLIAIPLVLAIAAAVLVLLLRRKKSDKATEQ